jgi:hypothetical protein
LSHDNGRRGRWRSQLTFLDYDWRRRGWVGRLKVPYSYVLSLCNRIDGSDHANGIAVFVNAILHGGALARVMAHLRGYFGHIGDFIVEAWAMVNVRRTSLGENLVGQLGIRLEAVR